MSSAVRATDSDTAVQNITMCTSQYTVQCSIVRAKCTMLKNSAKCVSQVNLESRSTSQATSSSTFVLTGKGKCSSCCFKTIKGQSGQGSEHSGVGDNTIKRQLTEVETSRSHLAAWNCNCNCSVSIEPPIRRLLVAGSGWIFVASQYLQVQQTNPVHSFWTSKDIQFIPIPFSQRKRNILITLFSLPSVTCFRAGWSQFALWEVLEKSLICWQLNSRWQMPLTRLLGIRSNFPLSQSGSADPHHQLKFLDQVKNDKIRGQNQMQWLYDLVFGLQFGLVSGVLAPYLPPAPPCSTFTPRHPLCLSVKVLLCGRLPVARVHNNNLCTVPCALCPVHGALVASIQLENTGCKPGSEAALSRWFKPKFPASINPPPTYPSTDTAKYKYEYKIQNYSSVHCWQHISDSMIW